MWRSRTRQRLHRAPTCQFGLSAQHQPSHLVSGGGWARGGIASGKLRVAGSGPGLARVVEEPSVSCVLQYYLGWLLLSPFISRKVPRTFRRHLGRAGREVPGRHPSMGADEPKVGELEEARSSAERPKGRTRGAGVIGSSSCCYLSPSLQSSPSLPDLPPRHISPRPVLPP